MARNVPSWARLKLLSVEGNPLFAILLRVCLRVLFVDAYAVLKLLRLFERCSGRFVET